jgi:hypothetical protein
VFVHVTGIVAHSPETLCCSADEVSRSEIGLSRVAEARTRSIRITNLPPATQEGLLQQMLAKIIPVSRVEVFIDKQEAIVELMTPAVSPALPTLLWDYTDGF